MDPVAPARRSATDRDADQVPLPFCCSDFHRCSKARNKDTHRDPSHRDNTQRHLPTETTHRPYRDNSQQRSLTQTPSTVPTYHTAPQRPYTETSHMNLMLPHRSSERKLAQISELFRRPDSKSSRDFPKVLSIQTSHGNQHSETSHRNLTERLHLQTVHRDLPLTHRDFTLRPYPDTPQRLTQKTSQRPHIHFSGSQASTH